MPCAPHPPRPGSAPPRGRRDSAGKPQTGGAAMGRHRLEQLLREQAVVLRGAEDSFFDYRTQIPAPPRGTQPPDLSCPSPLLYRPSSQAAHRRPTSAGAASDLPVDDDVVRQMFEQTQVADCVVSRVSATVGQQLLQLQEAIQWRLGQVAAAVKVCPSVQDAPLCTPVPATAAERTRDAEVQCDLLQGPMGHSAALPRNESHLGASQELPSASSRPEGTSPATRKQLSWSPGVVTENSPAVEKLPISAIRHSPRLAVHSHPSASQKALPPGPRQAAGLRPLTLPVVHMPNREEKDAWSPLTSQSRSWIGTHPQGALGEHPEPAEPATWGSSRSWSRRSRQWASWSANCQSLDDDPLGVRDVLRSLAGQTGDSASAAADLPSCPSEGGDAAARSSPLRTQQTPSSAADSAPRVRGKLPASLGDGIVQTLVNVLDEFSEHDSDSADRLEEMLCEAAHRLVAAESITFLEVVTQPDGSLCLSERGFSEPLSVNSLCGTAAVLRTAVTVEGRQCVLARDDFRAEVDVPQGGGVPENIMVLPIAHESKVFGVLRVVNKLAGPQARKAGADGAERTFAAFGATDEWALGVLLHVFATRFHSLQQVVTVAAASESLVRMLNMVLDLFSASNTAQLHSSIIENLKDIVGAERCLLHFVDGETLVTPLGDREPLRVPLQSPRSGVAGRVAASGLAVNLQSAYSDSRFCRQLDQQTDFRTRTMLCVPVRCIRGAEERIVAVVELANKCAHPRFGDDDQKLCEVFARFAGIAIEKLTSLDMVTNSQEQNQKMLEVARRLASVTMDADALRDNIIEEARQLTSADRGALFVANWDAQELSATFGKHTMRMPINRGIAGTVATSGASQNIADAYADGRFNKEVDISTGYRTQSLLAVPVKFEGQVVAVAQLVNKKSQQGTVCSFGDADEAVLDSFGTFAGIAIRISQHIKQTTKEKARFKAMLAAVAGMTQVDLGEDYDGFCENIVFRAKNLIGADRCTFYLVDKERGELFSRFADSVGVKEIRFKMSQGIAGEVAVTGKVCNIQDAYSDTRFNTDIDKQLGYVTKNMLVVPVKGEDAECLAVIQLINKEDGVPFDEEDEEMLLYFSNLCARMIRSVQLFRAVCSNRSDLEKLVSLSSGAEPERLGSGLPVAQDTAAVEPLLAATVTPAERELLATRDFDVHLYRTPEGLERLVVFAAALFEELGLVERFGLDRRVLITFIHRIQSRYRDVPYHNFAHAFDVTQTLFCILKQVRDAIPDLEVLTLMVSGLCHDVDHMGLNNSFHYKAETPLGILSNAIGSNSPLEVHHCNVAFEVMQQPDSNPFGGMRPADQARCFKTMLRIILGTDMARHKGLMEEFARFCDDPEADHAEHIELIVTMLLKAADISNPTKPFDISRKWAHSVTEEFYMQGDMERDAHGAVENPMMDRAKNNEMASGQVGFINFVCVPYYDLIARHWPQLKHLCEALAANRATWQDILATQTHLASGRDLCNR
eukprot:TRINITY_DN17083_c0_g1_i1.p1 TRINITY_DN17083_c0_g1~~TRINITY_DN17083_c0_g1_i1.p1  ORF type:complete len:1480 (+),score=441.93 TRINITY_DN17083_c0_g1_i1:106-4545(+)